MADVPSPVANHADCRGRVDSDFGQLEPVRANHVARPHARPGDFDVPAGFAGRTGGWRCTLGRDCRTRGHGPFLVLRRHGPGSWDAGDLLVPASFCRNPSQRPGNELESSTRTSATTLNTCEYRDRKSVVDGKR